MTASVVNDLLWTEKYRPTRLAEMALEDDTRGVVGAYIEAGEIPHLLFTGPPGSGKTTLARILMRELDCQCLILNASSERGIDVVRERIQSFAMSQFPTRWNVVFLDEADALTADAQTALRNLIEAYHDRTRFILTANHPYKIIPAIQSRCVPFTFGSPPLKERVRVLLETLKAEGITVADPRIALGYAERYTDMRKMLSAAQKAALVSGVLPPLTDMDVADGDTLYRLLVGKDWRGMCGLTSNSDFDIQQAARDLFWAIPDGHPKAGFMRHIIGRCVHESGFTPDLVVLFLAAVAEVQEGL